MKIKSISVFLGFLCFITTIAYGATVFDIGTPGTGKVNIFIEVEEETVQNNNFANHLRQMLETSLLFKMSNSKENADFTTTLSGSVESKEMVLSITSSSEKAFETIHLGARFRSNSKDYVELKAAQIGNQISSKLFGLNGALGSTIMYSLQIDSVKTIYKDKFGLLNKRERVNYSLTSNSYLAYSPDGKNIIYNRLTNKGNQIMVQQINPLKLNALSVYYDEGRGSAPFWGPDGSIFLTLHISEKNSDIFKFSLPSNPYASENPKLKKIKKLTFDPSIETEPRISPDGKKMAYVSDQTGAPQIYILDLATGKAKRLSRAGGYNATPAWSPDGKFVAFSGIRKRVSSIYRINVNSGKETRITPSDIQAESPTWSPDSSLIAFTGKKGSSTTKIYYSLVNGSGYQRLTKSDEATIESGSSWGMALR